MVTPTCRPALHHLDGRCYINGCQMTASIRIGSAPASATAAALKALESTLRHRPAAAPLETLKRLGKVGGKVVMSGHCGTLTRWHGQLSRSNNLQRKTIVEAHLSRVHLFLRANSKSRCFGTPDGTPSTPIVDVGVQAGAVTQLAINAGEVVCAWVAYAALAA